jgi:hypothetical protein
MRPQEKIMKNDNVLILERIRGVPSQDGPSDETDPNVTAPTGKQAEPEPHPLASHGHHRLPHRLWRISPRLFVIASAIRDIWLIATGRTTLHRAWQRGHDDGVKREYTRTVINGGR